MGRRWLDQPHGLLNRQPEIAALNCSERWSGSASGSLFGFKKTAFTTTKNWTSVTLIALCGVAGLKSADGINR
jgi:hypothetical protein